MSIDKAVVQYAANLSRIEISQEELQVLSVQLAGILDFIDKLKQVDVEQVPPTSHILPINNVLRRDGPSASLTQEAALKNAPQKQGGFFSVPKVIE
jgi:aspartyl-tRNA(Asn)/glutamyl-tRNA(Gln) amidotransferase subunit C